MIQEVQRRAAEKIGNGWPVQKIALTTIAVVALVLLGIALFFRIWHLAMIPGVNGDEAFLGCKAFDVAHGGRLDWKTNSGNLTDPFYILPLIALHKIFTPSVLLLRSVAVISGVLMLPLNFWLCNRILDRLTAVASTLLLAVLPVNIVYSRFGWEPSQTVLFSIPVLYLALLLCGGTICPLLGVSVLGSLFVFSCLVHPTNFFLSGICATACIALVIKPELSPRRLLGFLGAVFLVTLTLGLIAMACAPQGVREEVQHRLLSLAWMQDGGRFLLAWMRLFNGLNALSYTTGSWPVAREIFDSKQLFPYCWPDIPVLFIFVFALGVLSQQILPTINHHPAGLRKRQDLVLVSGFIFFTLLFYILNGSGKVAVWNERYGLWAVAPGVLLLASGWVHLRQRYAKFRIVMDAIGLLLCGMLLVETWQGYFHFAQTTGGESEMDSRVGRTEIHALAIAELVKDFPHSGYGETPLAPVLISSDWFVYWPMIYLLRRECGWKSWETIYEKADSGDRSTRGSGWLPMIRQHGVVFADFVGSPAWKVWDKAIDTSSIRYRTELIPDVAGRPVLMIKFPENGDRSIEVKP